MKLNQTIKRLRKGKGMTQEQLAELLNVSLMTVRRWEWGETSPKSNKLVRLAEIFGVTLDTLLEDDTEATPVSTVQISSQKVLPNMAYWGAVADNARNVAEYGNAEDMTDVMQMLRRALGYIGTKLAGRDEAKVATA